MNAWLDHLFMICSNIKLTDPAESIGSGILSFRQQNQGDRWNPGNASPIESKTDPRNRRRRRRKDQRRRKMFSNSLSVLRDEASTCRACPLWKDATQTV